jgi:hypothetical protein
MSSPFEEPVAPAVKQAKPFDPLMLARGFAGAVVGGAVGYVVFRLLAQNGFYGILIPGALLGMGAGWAARGKSQLLGIVCFVLAIGLTLFTEWHVMFARNNTFADFLSKIHTLSAVRLIMLALGPVMAYWFGRGR